TLPPSSVLISLFLRHAAHRDLPSFPTRRSSDLGLGPIGYAFAIFHLITHGFFKAGLFLGAGSVMHGMNDEIDMRGFGNLRNRPRSEEHTSELQSRFDLVCRLLLEKKNKKKY